MFEIFRKYFLSKFGNTLYTERVSARSPTNNRLYCLILSKLNSTSTISKSLLINKGSCVIFPLLLLLLFITIFYYLNYI